MTQRKAPGWLLLVTLVAFPALSPGAAAREAQPAAWLDVPLAAWNVAGGAVPAAPAGEEPVAAILSRCQLKPPQATDAERAVQAAGWIPFWNVDQQLVREDVEIVGGMRGASGSCEPMTFNLFVFVAGRFAGTLSASHMSSRLDGSTGVVRLAPPRLAAEFARYASGDPPCCPSSRVSVNYRIDRTAAGPVVVPVDIRTTRP